MYRYPHSQVHYSFRHPLRRIRIDIELVFIHLHVELSPSRRETNTRTIFSDRMVTIYSEPQNLCQGYVWKVRALDILIFHIFNVWLVVLLTPHTTWPFRGVFEQSLLKRRTLILETIVAAKGIFFLGRSATVAPPGAKWVVRPADRSTIGRGLLAFGEDRCKTSVIKVVLADCCQSYPLLTFITYLGK